MADPLLKSVYIEMKMMDAGYTYTELCGMDYTEFMLRYSILKVLKRAD